MEKYAWRARIVVGKQDEYVKRHREIWPEMVQTLKAAGIINYTIWRDGDDLFGYYECEKGIGYAAEYQRTSPVVKRWNEYMQDVLIMETDEETGAQPQMEKVFELN